MKIKEFSKKGKFYIMMREFNFVSTPIVDIVNDIIIDSVIKNASDIHLDPAEKYLKIRIRIDGDLRDYAMVDNKYKRNLTTRIKLLAGMNITESRLPQDGAIKSVIQGKDLDLRVSALPTSFGEKIVIRILDYSMSLQGLETLGFTDENYNIIQEMVSSPNGIILITGATGSGKSTTVYSMLQKLNREEINIITVEDPVEMSIEGLNQVQVNSEIGLDFAAVLRSILRQDPNVILIGEIRDSETAKIAVRASITGHLVLSTLHTNSSLTTIERLIDMNVERYLLSSSLKGIVSQTLAKKLCPSCRVQRKANDTEKAIFKKVLGQDVEYIYEAGRCDNCHNGYTGRIALQEVLLINDAIREAINQNIDREELRRLIYSKGVKTLLQDGLIKVLAGITDLKEVFRLVDYDESDILFSNNRDVDYAKVNDGSMHVQDKDASDVSDSINTVSSGGNNNLNNYVNSNNVISNDVNNNAYASNVVTTNNDSVIKNVDANNETPNNSYSDTNNNVIATNNDSAINNVDSNGGASNTIVNSNSYANASDNIVTPNNDVNANMNNNVNSVIDINPVNNMSSANVNDNVSQSNGTINIPNTSTNANVGSTNLENNISPSQVNSNAGTSEQDNNIFNAKGNLFDDNVFNNLRIDNSQANNQGTTVNTSNFYSSDYTNDLLNRINNGMKDA